MRILIAFASKSKSAELLASHIVEGCRIAGIEPEMLNLGDSYKLFDYLPIRSLLPKSKIQMPHDLSSYDIIFIGFEIHNASESGKFLDFIESHDFSGKRVALFCSYYVNRKYLDRIVKKLEGRNAQVFNTISLKRKGLSAFIGFGSLDENDLVRAEAFAERTINNTLGRKVRKDSEKSQIKGYRK